MLHRRPDPGRMGATRGEPGLGKTRLVLDFARFVSSNATVLVGRCDSEALVPFAPFVEMLQWLLQACPAVTLRSRLTGIEGSAELAQLVPEIAKELRVKSQSVPFTAEGRRYRMFEAFASLLRATSRSGPVLLVLEDVHWADRGSMLLLRHLVRAAHDAAICTIATYCDSEVSRSPWFDETLTGLRREPSATRVALGGLSEDHVRSLITAFTGRRAAPYLVRFVSENTQGNPLFITEMLRHLSDRAMLSRLETMRGKMSLTDLGLPQSVRDLIGRRLSRLSGRYDEALAAFDEARAFGRHCGALPLLARATSMSVAPLLGLADLEGAAMRALEARELAHRVGFEPPIVSAGIDLLLISARSDDPGRSETLLPEVARAMEKASGWHAWKWRLRLWEARAELALARCDWNEALIAAGHVVEQSSEASEIRSPRPPGTCPGRGSPGIDAGCERCPGRRGRCPPAR